jgi:hypothetical protein
MPRSRPAKAAGTDGLLDMARQPSRLGQIPPEPGESRRDIAAIERGEARRVSCYLRNPAVSGRRGPRQGGLELSTASVSWRPFLGFRRGARPLDIRSVTLECPAGPSDQRFGVPGNPHLFSLVRWATPDGRLDLLVPTADLPLVTWRLGGEAMPPGGESAQTDRTAGAGRAARRPDGREIRRRGLAGAASVASPVVPIVLGARWLAMVAMNLGALLLATSIFSGFRVWRRERRIKRSE